MKIEQIYTGCLAHGAYYIESNGEAAIIDPLREVEPYILKAKNDHATVKYVFETHFHADFVSGHIDLSKKTGAAIVFGPNASPTFQATIANDNQVFNIGNIKIKVLHTPGHTLESSCYLLFNEKNKATALFTGDTLFIGDVGRPDLAQKLNKDLTKEMLAGYLFDSLRNKIMPLNDDIIIYPAHGAGSACGKNMSNETTDTLGHQKQTNYALQPELTKEKFTETLLTGLTAAPSYFPTNVLMNMQGYDTIESVKERGHKALSPKAFELIANETNAVIIDTRDQADFAKGFIPNSIFIGIDGNFAPWVGTLITDTKQNILLVTNSGREDEAIIRLARVGYDFCIGYLEGGIEAWKNAGFETDKIESISATILAEKYKNKAINILDVRKKSEFESEHIINAINIPLDQINDHLQMINKNKTYYVHCAGGYRSMIFISILRSRGYNNLVDIAGGFAELKVNLQFQMTSTNNQIEDIN
jgi:hydroxyacylglutathione hydrolase